MKKQVFILSLLLFFGIGLYAQPKIVGEPKMIAKMDEPLTRPVWSPDGAKLFLNYGQWEVAATGAGLRQASADAGNQLRATACGNSLVSRIISEPLQVASQVEGLKSLEGEIVFNPVLSPQGDKIVFQAGNGMYICNTDGSGLRILGTALLRATWTADGKYVVAATEGNDGHVITNGELVSVNVATGARSLLLSSNKYIATSPAISPDGKQLAFEDYANGAIYVVDIQ